jgi:hypothetical protein
MPAVLVDSGCVVGIEAGLPEIVLVHTAMFLEDNNFGASSMC